MSSPVEFTWLLTLPASSTRGFSRPFTVSSKLSTTRSLTQGSIRQKATAGTSLLEKLVRSLSRYRRIHFHNSILVADEKEVKKEKPKEEPSSHFQRQRVDMLLGTLLQKFPIPQAAPVEQANKPDDDKTTTGSKNDGKTDATPVTIKQEPMDPSTNDGTNTQIPASQIKQEPSSGPPEKKMKINN